MKLSTVFIFHRGEVTNGGFGLMLDGSDVNTFTYFLLWGGVFFVYIFITL